MSTVNTLTVAERETLNAVKFGKIPTNFKVLVNVCGKGFVKVNNGNRTLMLSLTEAGRAALAQSVETQL